MNAKDIIAAARVRVVNKHPYCAAVLLSLRPHPMPGLGTVAVTAGWTLLYDPKTIEEWGVGGATHDGAAAALAHEVWHCLRDTFGRKQARDMEKWNIASDAPINDDLLAAGWRFPIQAVTSPTLGVKPGLLAEEIYDKMPLAIQKPKPAAHTMPGCGGKCGGCAGNPHEQEKELSESGKGGGAPADGAAGGAPEPVSEADQTILRRQVAQEIQAAVRNGRGTVPAGIKAWADVELGPPQVDWRRRLASLVRGAIADRAGAHDYSYKRPARRQWALRAAFGARAAIVPCLRSPVPEVVVLVDTSGSMMGGPAESALAELLGIVKAVGSPVKVAACDAALQATARIAGKRDLHKIAIGGGGGTTLMPTIRELDKGKVDLLIVLTDGFCDTWLDPKTLRARLVAAITPGGQMPPANVPSVQIGGVK